MSKIHDRVNIISTSKELKRSLDFHDRQVSKRQPYNYVKTD